MRIQYCSDLHLEFELNRKYLSNFPLKISGDILILAGDIIPFHDEFLNDSFFKFISENYKQVFWIPGNHEFYYKDIAELNSSMIKKIGKNINLVNNTMVQIDGIDLIFSTLWSRISPSNEKFIEQSVSDFDLISNKNKKLRAHDFNKMHDSSLAFIKKSLNNSKNKSIVITHHLPSNLCNADRHKHSPINEAFCVDLTAYIENCGANFWIYGHSHHNNNPILIGETILLTNQLGYVKNNEHNDFKNNAYISI